MGEYYFDEENLNKEKIDEILTNSLQKSENNLYLIGAGCSATSGGLTMERLWNSYSEGEGAIENFQELRDLAGYKTGDNLEELLSYIVNAESFYRSQGEEKEEERKSLSEFKLEIEKRLLNHCKGDISLYNDSGALKDESRHTQFLDRITSSRKLSLPRAKIFTLNYDLLFEEAANYLGFTIIDGFSFSTPRKFNGTYYDLDIVRRNKNYLDKDSNFEKKVVHLYKLHGSVNWGNINGDIVQEDKQREDIGKIINPSSSKYEESYTMPYFEMISRFQQELRGNNVSLTIIGYSFSDKHINSIILEAFKNNPSLSLIIVGGSNIFDESGENKKLKKEIQELNGFLGTGRIFLFKMYFEPYVDLLPVKQGKTREEEIKEQFLKALNERNEQ